MKRSGPDDHKVPDRSKFLTASGFRKPCLWDERIKIFLSPNTSGKNSCSVNIIIIIIFSKNVESLRESRKR